MFPIPSAGELLRRERARPGSKYGELIERTIVAGNIVPAEITCALLHSAMDSSGRQFISLKIIWVILGVIFLAILGILINPGSVAFIALCITESDLGQNCVGVAHKRHSWKMTYFNLPPKILSREMTNKYVPEAGFLKTYRDVSAKPPKLPNFPVAQMSQSPNIPVGFFENLLPGATFYSTQLKGED